MGASAGYRPILVAKETTSGAARQTDLSAQGKKVVMRACVIGHGGVQDAGTTLRS